MTYFFMVAAIALYAAIEVGSIWRVLRTGRTGLALSGGAFLVFFVAPVCVILMSPQIHPGYSGPPGTGVGYLLPVIAVGAVVVHVAIVGIARGYVASIRAEDKTSNAAAKGK